MWQGQAAEPAPARVLQRLGGHRSSDRGPALPLGRACTGSVPLFDEVVTLRGDKDWFDALITVLNVGFLWAAW
jgi:hypothetical protein